MKITQILSASLLAGAVILSGTACSSTPSSPSSATAVSAEEEALMAEMEKTRDVSMSLNSYYNFLSMPDSQERVAQMGTELTNATDTDQKRFIFMSVGADRFFDLSTEQAITNAYNALVAGTAAMKEKPVHVFVGAEGFTMNGDTATFNSTYLDMMEVEPTEAGTPPTERNETPSPEQVVNLVKQDGNWVIVAKDAIVSPYAP